MTCVRSLIYIFTASIALAAGTRGVEGYRRLVRKGFAGIDEISVYIRKRKIW